MQYNDFKEAVASSVKERLDASCSVSVVDIVKVNDIHLDALVIKEDERNVTPTIYLNGFYDRFRDGLGFDAVIDEIIGLYEKNDFKDTVSMDFFFDYGKVKDHVIYRLVNKEKNRSLLETVPHKDYLDLAVIFYYYMDMDGVPEGYVLITNRHIEKWGITAAELYLDSCKNTPNLLAYEIIDFNKVIKDKLDDEEKRVFEDPVTFLPIYILTNVTRANGAGCILYDDLLGHISDGFKKSFYVLPSSVHETLLVFEDEEKDKGMDFGKMVKEINSTVLSDDEFLSDHAYFYDRATRQLSIAG